ncbi:MAG: hypothetical protein LCH93_09010 [Proteobacteria bacterium]|nr:hypothetical protein [Pseudomonadota bacterium]
MQPKGADVSICEKAGELLIEGGIGFGDWLSAIGKSFEAAAGGDPKFGPTGLTREVVFSVEQSRNASGTLRMTIVPVSVTASALAKRNDVQTLKVEMKPSEVVVGRNKDGSPKTKPRIDTFSGRLPIDLPLNEKMLIAP